MIYRAIPHTNFNASALNLGTMTFGSPVAEKEALYLMELALDLGINLLDTANMYEGYNRSIGSAGGMAETIIGKLPTAKRDQFILATKAGMNVGDGPLNSGTSAPAIRFQLEQSLKRLQSDHVELFYLHRFDPDCDLTETIAELAQLIAEGKIRHYGISNYSASQLRDLLTLADANGLPRPVIIQPPLSLLQTEALDQLLPLCENEQIAVTPYQIYQGGLLTGKYQRNAPIPANSRKAERNDWVWDLDETLFDQIDHFTQKAQKRGLTLPQYALQWTLEQPGVVSALIGVKTPEQLKAAVASVQ